MEKVILIIFVLTTQSSYTHDGEEPATYENYDTIQWWITQDSAFRISTFAKTNDIHIYQIDKPVPVELAIENTLKHYGDIVAKKYILEIPNINSQDELDKLVENELGKGSIEFVEHLNIGFWNYDERNYTNQTNP